MEVPVLVDGCKLGLPMFNRSSAMQCSGAVASEKLSTIWIAAAPAAALMRSLPRLRQGPPLACQRLPHALQCNAGAPVVTIDMLCKC